MVFDYSNFIDDCNYETETVKVRTVDDRIYVTNKTNEEMCFLLKQDWVVSCGDGNGTSWASQYFQVDKIPEGEEQWAVTIQPHGTYSESSTGLVPKWFFSSDFSGSLREDNYNQQTLFDTSMAKLYSTIFYLESLETNEERKKAYRSIIEKLNDIELPDTVTNTSYATGMAEEPEEASEENDCELVISVEELPF